MRNLPLAMMACAGYLTFVGSAFAAGPSVGSGHVYFHVDGTFVFDDEGSGIQNGFDPTIVFPGDGTWISGYAGYAMPSGWDWRIGAGFADLSAGETNGTGPNIYGIDDAKMFNVEANVGYDFETNGTIIRPFLGVQYLAWNQDQGFHPDVPLGCCFMNSKFDGFGPKVGFDASAPVSDMLRVVGGADISVLFGEIDYSAGTSSPASTGATNRTAFAASGYAGLDFSLTDNISLGARYHLMFLDGTSYDNQNLFATPFGKASNVLHGPSASLTIGF